MIELYFAEAAASPGLLEALGVDVKLLVVQTLAFLVLLALLSKFAFPAIIRMIDKREEAIQQTTHAAAEAEKKANEAEAKIEKLLKTARGEAADIVATAKSEAAALTEKSEAKSKAQAERIVADARETIDKEVSAAKKALHNDTIELVALATEKVTKGTLKPADDQKMISRVLEEVR